MFGRLVYVKHIAALVATISTTTSGQSSDPKRGLSLHGDTQDSDYNIFLTSRAPISWYYTWSPWPNSHIESDSSSSSQDVEFVPLLFGIDNLDADLSTLNQIASSTSSEHLLTFNEPDGLTSTGGADISPQDAARAYIDSILSLRGDWQISHPVVTGSGNGLNWLADFAAACADLNGDEGCPTDFVAAHWYGDLAGLASWLGQLHEFYQNTSHSFRSQSDSQDLEIWVTEFALPQQDAEATEAMMNQSLPYLDGLDYVARYAWFGLFRNGSDDADGWAGDGVALLEPKGGLTELGATYLGGEANGFESGDQVDDNNGGSGRGGGGGGNGSGNGNEGVEIRIETSALLLGLVVFMAVFA